MTCHVNIKQSVISTAMKAKRARKAVVITVGVMYREINELIQNRKTY